MDDPRWLRLVTIGLVLAALAVGYFLISGGFSQKGDRSQSEIASVTDISQPSPTPDRILGENTLSSPSPTPTSAYNRIVDRTRGGIQTLPNTGFPLFMVGVLSASAVIIGWGLRKFPH